MTHKPRYSLLHILSVTALLSGISLTATYGPTYATLSGGGVLLKATEPTATMLRGAADVAPGIYQQADAALQLTIGILLIVLGFFLHGLVRMRDERPVHITVKKGAKKKQTTWHWMEMHV